MGDCCTIEQRKLLSDVKEIFTEADKDGDGKLSLEEFKGKPLAHHKKEACLIKTEKLNYSYFVLFSRH